MVHRATKRLLPILMLITMALTAPTYARNGPVIGELFPDFVALDQTDTPFQLSNHRGKLVLLHFCAVWCGPCNISASVEAKLTEELNGKIGAANWLLVDVLVENNIGAATDTDDANSWRNRLHTPALTLHSSDTRLLEDLAVELGVTAFPTYFIVGPDGVLGDIKVGFDSNPPLVRAVVGVMGQYMDLAPPRISEKFDVFVETDLAPVAVQFASPSAVDDVDGAVPVFCDPPTGSKFPFGETLVICSATDAAGNTKRSGFNVVVRTPGTPGLISTPGNPKKPLTHVDPGQTVRIAAGGFEPGAVVRLSVTAANLQTTDLGETIAGDDGTIDARVRIPNKIPGGLSQVSAVSEAADGSEFIRAWLVTVDKGPPVSVQ